MTAIKELILSMEEESNSLLTKENGLSIEETVHLKALHRAIPLLREADSFFPTVGTQDDLVTYKIVSDLAGKLKAGARTACNFWNRFLIPKCSTVVRLGVFTSSSRTIARAYVPYMNDGIMYGVVEFNTKYLNDFSALEISGTIVHEIGHTLGMGWEKWMDMFDRDTGKFDDDAVLELDSLRNMFVETDYGAGTRYSHWDEERFDRELMTGFQDSGEYVLPVTIDVMKSLGHQVIERLEDKTDLSVILSAVSQIQFTRQQEAKSLDLDFYKKTKIFEEIPHSKKIGA